jgi:hypothetical protein
VTSNCSSGPKRVPRCVLASTSASECTLRDDAFATVATGRGSTRGRFITGFAAAFVPRGRFAAGTAAAAALRVLGGAAANLPPGLRGVRGCKIRASAPSAPSSSSEHI